jgi:hypothetical protein
MTTTAAAQATCAASASRGLAQQEAECRAVERLGVLVQPSVREMLEDNQFAPGDPALERLGEAGGADDSGSGEVSPSLLLYVLAVLRSVGRAEEAAKCRS